MPASSTAPAAAPPRFRPWVAEAIWVVAVGLLTLIVATIAFKLWRGHAHLPIVAGSGDYLVNLAAIKAMVTHGWWWHVPELGAPQGLSFYDFPLFFGDLWHFGQMKFFSIFSQDPVLLYNAFMIAGFPLAAMSAFGVQRDLGISHAVALVTSVLFATLPYHYGPTAFTHTAYYAVPLVVWLVIGVLTGRDVWSWHGRIPLPTLKVAIAVLVIAGGSVYWMVFCLVLIVVATPISALMASSWRPVLLGIASAALVAVLAVLVQAPSLIDHLREGGNPVAAVRQPFESEIYGLKLADLLIPSKLHPVGFMANLGDKYFATTTLPAEGVFNAWLGLTGTVGLIIGVLALLKSGFRRPTVLSAAALVAVLGVIVAWTGGISTLIAWYVSPQIRAWDRMSVVIGFAALVCVAVLLDAWRVRLNVPTVSNRRYAFGAGLALLLLVASFDQLPKGLGAKAGYEALDGAWRSQVRYTAQVVATLPKKDPSVLQLPYVSFPENGPILNMADYEQIRPFDQTDVPVHWSGGAMKGRESDWGPEIANWSTVQLLERAVAAGFDGLWIDRRAYEDQGQALVGQVQKILGGEGALGAPDGSIAYFDLQAYAAKEAKGETAQERTELADELIHPIGSTFGPGFGAVEQGGGDSWRWLGATGSIAIHNTSDTARTVTLKATAFRAVGDADTSISITSPASCRQTAKVALAGTKLALACNVPVGDTTLQFSTGGPQVPVGAGQPRPDLHVRLSDLAVVASDN